MVTEGRTRMVREDETGEIKKGPWKAEEDEVLINHVRKYGPRDWSSIRSKGLLQRTGKSCRLRWVNKLRPNLKTGVKFSSEEERTVIDLQAQFGNKWAKIATYLSGRTDNDVKNFWSSRQKRLARILHTSASSSTTSHNTTNRILPSMEAPKLSPSTEEESVTKPQSCCSSSHIPYSDTIKMEPILPDFVYHGYEHLPFQFQCTPPEKKPLVGPHFHIPAPPPVPQLQPELFPLTPLESQEFITRLGDLNFVDHVFGGQYSIASAQLPILPSSSLFGKGETNDVVTPGGYADDFPPIDMFDQIEPLPSPSKW